MSKCLFTNNSNENKIWLAAAEAEAEAEAEYTDWLTDKNVNKNQNNLSQSAV